jgi:hypothetical protein
MSCDDLSHEDGRVKHFSVSKVDVALTFGRRWIVIRGLFGYETLRKVRRPPMNLAARARPRWPTSPKSPFDKLRAEVAATSANGREIVEEA